MEQWIRHLVEPKRLILEWRPPEHIRDRRRWAVGELRRVPGGAEFHYLSGSELEAANNGRGAEQLRAAGFLGYPAFSWGTAHAESVYREGALEAFFRRLPSQCREDFPRYLERFYLRPHPDLSSFALLATTGASLPNDGFSLIDPLDGDVKLQDVILEANGYRHYAENLGRPLEVGSQADLVLDPSNEHDPHAVKIEVGGQLIGYISRFQSHAVSRWVVRHSAAAWLIRTNGSAVQPRAFIFVEVRAEVLQPVA